MRFQKGQSGNPAGRKPGIKDRRTASRRRLGKVVHAYITGSLKADLAELNPRERIQAITRFLPYVFAHEKHEDGEGLDLSAIIDKITLHAD